MPSMGEHESNSKVNLLLVGHSSAGKTGALASLIDAGLKVRVLDFDNGLSVLKGYVKDKKKLIENVHYVELNDQFKFMNSRVSVTQANSWQVAMDALDKGEPFGKGIPPLKDWGPDCVLVCDSLALAGKSALFMQMVANARGSQAPHQSDYGTAMESIERFLDMVTSSMIKCHVIVITHLVQPDGSTMVLPEALGSKLPPKVGKKFDNMLSVSISPGSQKRVINTKKDGLLALKSSIPLDDTYPIETGLADIFKKLTGKATLV